MNNFQILYGHCSLIDLLGTVYESYPEYRKECHRYSFVLRVHRLAEQFVSLSAVKMVVSVSLFSLIPLTLFCLNHSVTHYHKM